MIEILIALSTTLLTYYPIVVTVASLLIKFLPEFPATHWLKPILQFMGKYVAINRTSDNKLSITINDSSQETPPSNPQV